MLPETRRPPPITISPQELTLTKTLSSFKLKPIIKETKASFVTLLKDPDQRTTSYD